MHILLTALSLVALIGCFLSYTRATREAERAGEGEEQARRTANKLFEDRTRITTNEREIDALRRELRKLSGKFYAQQREIIDTVAAEQEDGSREHVPVSLFCPNYGIAQKEGPASKAAKCDCGYCNEMRERKAAFRERQREAGHLNPTWVKEHSTGTGNHGE